MPKITAVGYARYSTEHQTENSIEYQTAAIEKYCRENDINLLRVFKDEAQTGTNLERPGFQDMLQAARLKLFDTVIIYDVTRGSRNVADWFSFRQDMAKLNVKVISTTQPLGDYTDPNTFLHELISVGMGHHYVLDIRKKSIDGKTAAAKHGTFQGGTCPLGYDIVDQQYVINNHEAEIVRKIYKMYADGESYSKIVEALKGEKTKRGAAFSRNSLNTILQNERYIGVYTWNKTIEREFRKWVGRKPNPNMVRIENAIPPIVDKEIWDRVRERMRDRKGRARNKAKRTYLLTGMITCHDCGSTYIGQTVHNQKGTETRYYVCGRKYRVRDCKPKNINAERIEKFVIKSLRHFLMETDFTAAAQLIAEAYNSYKPDLTAERRELTDVNKQIENGVNTILSGMNFPELQEKIESLRRRKSELEAYITEQELTAPEPITADMVIADMQESLKALDENNLKVLIKKHIKKIEAYNDGSYTVIVVIDTVVSARTF